MQRVAVIEPSSSGVKLIDRAIEMGLAPVVVIAQQGDRSLPVEYLRRVAETVIVDTNDIAATEEAVKAVHDRDPLAAVVAGCEYYVPLTASVAAALDLPGLPPSVASKLRFKHLMRGAVEAAGVDQPRFAVVEHEKDLVDAIVKVGLPCVLKPVDGSGSLNVRKAESIAECVRAFRTSINGAPVERLSARAAMVLVEEYIAGPEFSIEGFVVEGEARIAAFTEKALGPEPYFLEIGHVIPARLEATVKAQIDQYVRAVLHALELTSGPFHAEVRLGERGPLLMEVGARLAGDRIPDLLRLARGADLYEATLSIALGRSVSFSGEPRAAAAIRYVIGNGISVHGGLDLPLELQDEVEEFVTVLPPGRPIAVPGSSSSRFGYVILTGGSPDDVLTKAEAVAGAVKVQPHS